MNDREIYDLIGKSALADAPRPDFEDVKRRIAESAADDDTFSAEEDFFGFDQKQTGFTRYAAAAAALLVAVLGVAAIAGSVMTSPNNNMTADSSAYYEEADYADDAAPLSEEQENAVNSFVAKEAPAAYDTLDEAFDEDAVSDESAVTTTTAAQSAETEPSTASPSDAQAKDGRDGDADISSISFEPYHIKELGMTLDVPTNAYCTGTNVAENYPPLARFGIDAGTLESNYRSRGISFNAVWFDDGADVVEIVAAAEDVSDAANSLASFSEYELEKLRQSYMLYGIESPDSPRYYDVSVVTIGKQPYIRALGQDRAGGAYHAQYMTIINGQRIKLSLIEHYTEAPMPEDGISPAHEALMDKIARSVRYDHVRSQFAYRLSRLSLPVWVSLIGIVILLAYGVKYLIDQRKLAEQQLAEDQAELAEMYDAQYGGHIEHDSHAGYDGSNDSGGESAAQPEADGGGDVIENSEDGGESPEQESEDGGAEQDDDLPQP